MASSTRSRVHRRSIAPRAQRADPRLVVPEPPALHDPPALVDHAHRVLLAGPINAREPRLAHHPHRPSDRLTDRRREVPWRLLTDGALRARPPVAAQRAPRRNVGRRWSKTGPLHGQAQTGALPTSADPQRMTSKPDGAVLDALPVRDKAA